jgi:D-arabinose 1-dehydrogenase-like Zn-dependent alcohol dehydrogenase
VNSCDLSPGQWLAIVGCGGVGQYAIQYAKAMGLHIIGLDINNAALELAQELGADKVLNTLTMPNAIQEVLALTGGGVHAAAVFSAALPAFKTAIECLKLNGLLMVVGMPAKPLPVDALDLIVGRYRIKGESTSIPQRMKKAIDFTAENNIQPHVEFHALAEAGDLFERIRTSQTNRKLVVIF